MGANCPLPCRLYEGGNQKINCVNLKGAFRLIQSIPSKNAEPFKLWLAQLGKERIEEIQNPEILQNRAKEIYEKKKVMKNLGLIKDFAEFL